MIAHDGSLRISNSLDNNDAAFIKEITPGKHLEKNILSDEFLQYLNLRNASVDIENSIAI